METALVVYQAVGPQWIRLTALRRKRDVHSVALNGSVAQELADDFGNGIFESTSSDSLCYLSSYFLFILITCNFFKYADRGVPIVVNIYLRPSETRKNGFIRQWRGISIRVFVYFR